MNIVTIKEVSEFIKVKESTIYSWAGCGSIPSYKIWGLLRFDIDEIKEWVKKSVQIKEVQFKSKIKSLKNINLDKHIKKIIANVKK